MQLPPKADLKHLKNQAKQLLAAHQKGDIEACTRFKTSLPRLSKTSPAETSNIHISLQEAQYVIAKEYGYANWSQLSAAVTTSFDNVLIQYSDASNLNARKNIHEQYSTNKQDYNQWLFDFYNFPQKCRILDLGSGAAYLWRENSNRINTSWNITLSDISSGILDDARQNLAQINRSFAYEVIDAQSIPFEGATFDIIIANGMLYHVPNLEKALSEIHRTLKPNGSLYATSSSFAHMRELWELTKRFDPNTILSKNRAEIFGIENGYQRLEPFFNDIKSHRFSDSLIVPDAEAIVAYVLSTSRSSLAEKNPQKFLAFIDHEIALDGPIHITKGHRVPAYLLIPRGEHKAPLPAMICFHQCALNCAIGKEAVVGKAPWSYEATDWDFPLPHVRMSADRTDQAYGHDLVHQGFVVLAPDSICCGERHIEAIRQEGENCDGCFKHLTKHLGRDGNDKHVFDNMRAVDLLQSLPFVDSERIGAIGHSMGASDVYNLMAVDKRVVAGIASGDGMGGRAAYFLALISPRLYIGIKGMFDGPADKLPKTQEMHADARPFYEADGAGENLVLLTPKMGHLFGDKVKWIAYKRLKKYFGVLPPRKKVDLSEIVMEAREASRWMPEEEQGGTFPEPRLQEGYFVSINKKELVSALAGLYLHVADMDSQAEVRVAIEEESDDYIVDCRVSINREDNSDFEGASYQTLRDVERILSEHDTALRQNHLDHELRYQISFPKFIN